MKCYGSTNAGHIKNNSNSISCNNQRLAVDSKVLKAYWKSHHISQGYQQVYHTALDNNADDSNLFITGNNIKVWKKLLLIYITTIIE